MKEKEIIELLHCWHPGLEYSSLSEGVKITCCRCGIKSKVVIRAVRKRGHGKYFKENKAFAVEKSRCKIKRSYYNRLQNERN